MIYSVHSQQGIIGTTLLAARDPSIAVAWGAFSPSAAFASVREVFAIFAAAINNHDQLADHGLMRHYYQQRDALGLRLVNEQGRVFPTTAIHIELADPEDDLFDVTVFFADTSFFEQPAS